MVCNRRQHAREHNASERFHAASLRAFDQPLTLAAPGMGLGLPLLHGWEQASLSHEVVLDLQLPRLVSGPKLHHPLQAVTDYERDLCYHDIRHGPASPFSNRFSVILNCLCDWALLAGLHIPIAAIRRPYHDIECLVSARIYAIYLSCKRLLDVRQPPNVRKCGQLGDVFDGADAIFAQPEQHAIALACHSTSCDIDRYTIHRYTSHMLSQNHAGMGLWYSIDGAWGVGKPAQLLQSD